MSLLYAVGFLAAAAILVRPFYVANRLPRIPRWAGSGMTTCFVMLATGFMALGVGFSVEFALSEEQVVSGVNAVAALAMIAVAAALWVAIGRIVRGRRQRDVVEMPVKPTSPTVPEMPVAPRRAA